MHAHPILVDSLYCGTKYSVLFEILNETMELISDQHYFSTDIRFIVLFFTGMSEIKEWQQRPLNPVYTFCFMDAIHYKIKDDGKICNRASYVVIGVDVEGNKDILGIWIGENESSKFWLSVMNDLKNRGVQDVMLFCVDGLTGLKEAINAAFPMAEVQRCIIHPTA